MVEALTVRATADGRLLAPPEGAVDRDAENVLRSWVGSPLDARNLGAWIEPGTPLAVISGDEGWVAWAGVEQADVPAIEIRSAGRLVADQLPTEILTGRVLDVARRARSNASEMRRDSSRSDSSLGDGWYHVVQIEIDSPVATLLPGARGVAKIATYESTVGELVMNQSAADFPAGVLIVVALAPREVPSRGARRLHYGIKNTKPTATLASTAAARVSHGK